jgi:hypothetical protein
LKGQYRLQSDELFLFPAPGKSKFIECIILMQVLQVQENKKENTLCQNNLPIYGRLQAKEGDNISRKVQVRNIPVLLR